MLQRKTAGSSTGNITTILLWEKYYTPHFLSEEQNIMLGEEQDGEAVSVHCKEQQQPIG
jgi:hypothetical protein